MSAALTPAFRASLLVCLALTTACGKNDNRGPREPGTVAFSQPAFTVVEDEGAAVITVVRADGEDGQAEVQYSATAITADSTHFQPVTGTLRWNRRESGTRTFEVPITDDVEYQGSRTIALTLSSAQGAALGGLSTATLTIEDDDAPISGQLSFGATSYAAGEATASVVVTVVRRNGRQLPATVDYSAAPGSASAEDFTPVSGTLAWGDGEDDTKGFTLFLQDDTRHEGPETVVLTLTNATGASLGANSATTLTINDDDPPGTVAFSTTQYSVQEFAGQAVITVSRDGDSNGSARVNYAAASGSATAGSDFTATSGSLNWGDGESGSKTFSVPITDDDIDESRETVSLSLSNPVGAELGVPAAATLSINDNDDPPPPPPDPGVVSLDWSSRTVLESAGTVTVTVRRTSGSDGAASVDYSASNGSATSGEDFTAVSGTLNWSDGDSAPKVFGIPVIDDAVDEPSETVSITISNASNASLGSPSIATLTITDNDNPTTGTFTLSGTVSVAFDSFVDSDVNDVLTTPVSNDTPGTAQVLPNTVTLGGYANEANAGEPGNSFSAGDELDYYRIELLAGQNVNMYVADSSGSNDLDLLLYEASDPGTLVDSSLSSGPDETVTAPIDGDYLVVVTVWSGASNYVLQTGPQATARREQRGSGTNFVSGEVIVAHTADSTMAKAGVDPILKLGLARRLGAPDRPMLYELPAPGLPVALIDGRVPAYVSQHASPEMHTLFAMKQLSRRRDIKYAEPNYVHQPALVPNDPSYGAQWHYPLINLPAAWDVTTGSTDVIVAVIDTGVVLAHPDLAGQFDPSDPNGYDFISSPSRARDGDGIDGNADDPGDEAGFGSSFHGTHVAGTVAAATNNGIGVSGVAWNARIMPLRVLGLGGGTGYDIQQAVRYAAGLSNDSGTVPAQRADVMNLSLGCNNCFSQSEQDTYTAARNAGVIIVAAAGNSGNTVLGYPASYAGVVSVASVGPNRNRAYYSQFNSAVDVAAPGGNQSATSTDGVLSTHASGSGSIQPIYSYLQGTSMASPHLAGVVALMKSVYPAMTPQEFDDLLFSGTITEDLGAPGRDNSYGHGLIDAREAVAAATQLAGGGPPPENPVLGSSPGSLNFGAFLDNATFDLSNIGTGALSVLSVTGNQPWMSVAAESVDGDGLGRYRVDVNRGGLADGLYQGTISVDSDANDLAINVTVQVGTNSQASGGYTYLLLLDPQTYETLDEVSLGPTDGEYDYSFEDVAPGTYVIIAGTDQDNDFLVCDNGEACGAYITLSDIAEVEVTDSDVTGLDFLTGFEFSISGSMAEGVRSRPPLVRRRGNPPLLRIVVPDDNR